MNCLEIKAKDFWNSPDQTSRLLAMPWSPTGKLSEVVPVESSVKIQLTNGELTEDSTEQPTIDLTDDPNGNPSENPNEESTEQANADL